MRLELVHRLGPLTDPPIKSKVARRGCERSSARKPLDRPRGPPVLASGELQHCTSGQRDTQVETPALPLPSISRLDTPPLSPSWSSSSASSSSSSSSEHATRHVVLHEQLHVERLFFGGICYEATCYSIAVALVDDGASIALSCQVTEYQTGETLVALTMPLNHIAHLSLVSLDLDSVIVTSPLAPGTTALVSASVAASAAPARHDLGSHNLAAITEQDDDALERGLVSFSLAPHAAADFVVQLSHLSSIALAPLCALDKVHEKAPRRLSRLPTICTAKVSRSQYSHAALVRALAQYAQSGATRANLPLQETSLEHAKREMLQLASKAASYSSSSHTSFARACLFPSPHAVDNAFAAEQETWRAPNDDNVDRLVDEWLCGTPSRELARTPVRGAARKLIGDLSSRL